MEYKLNEALSVYKDGKKGKYIIFDVESGQIVARVNDAGSLILKHIEKGTLDRIIETLNDNQRINIKRFLKLLIKNKIIEDVR